RRRFVACASGARGVCRRCGHRAVLHARAAIGVQSILPRLRAQARRKRDRRLRPVGEVSRGEAWLGRRLDYLQYVATSATATYHLLMAYRDHPSVFGDAFAANRLPGPNGVPDVLDEARHGIEWLLRMFPSDSELYNQLGDDRDHTYLD